MMSIYLFEIALRADYEKSRYTSSFLIDQG